MGIEEILVIGNTIEGYLTRNEGVFLYEQAIKCSIGSVIVEIGSWKGKSTYHLAQGSKDGNKVKVYTIDPHTGSRYHYAKEKARGEIINTFPEFETNMKRVGMDDIIIPMVMTSEEASKKWCGMPIGLLFIDGDHEYDSVKIDFNCWYPYLMKGGIIAFHDSKGGCAVDRVVEEEIKEDRFENISSVDSITYARKR